MRSSFVPFVYLRVLCAKIATCIVLFLFVAESRAQEYPSLFWEITGKGISQPSYLYGTVHSFDKNAFRYVPQLHPRISASDVFAQEIITDPAQVDLAEIAELSIMPGDTTIAMLLDTGEYKRLSQYVSDTIGMPMVFLARRKPFVIMSLFLQEAMTTDVARFLDDSLAQFAKLAGKKVIGLETVGEQIRAIDIIPLKEQAQMLLQEIDSAHTSSASEQLKELTRVYASGSLDSLYARNLQEDMPGTHELALIIDRNHRMADRIEKYLADKVRMFVAVGALHLPGDEGVINLLRKKGFTVTPIKLN